MKRATFFSRTLTVLLLVEEKDPFSLLNSKMKQAGNSVFFTIDKGIIEKIIGEMIYSSTDDCTDAADEDAVLDGENYEDERMDVSIASSRFCTASNHRDVIADRLVLAVRAKEIALSLFERIDTGVASCATQDTSDSNVDGSSAYSYVATITKPLLFA